MKDGRTNQHQTLIILRALNLVMLKTGVLYISVEETRLLHCSGCMEGSEKKNERTRLLRFVKRPLYDRCTTHTTGLLGLQEADIPSGNDVIKDVSDVIKNVSDVIKDVSTA